MSHERCFMLLRPSDLTLPEAFGWMREPPRKPEERQPGYMEKFDFRTLYYDVFDMGGVVTGIGPPLMNLRRFVDSSDIRVDGAKVTVEITDLDRVQVTSFKGEFPSARVLTVDHDVGSMSCTIGCDLAQIFLGRNVIVTKSKNNRLSWIRDWVQYHISIHGVDGLVLHDNGSTDYSAAELLDSLRMVRGLSACVVVDWSYPYGPQGGVWAGNKSIKWDSDYCQYGMLEHARRRLLRNAGVVINHDIDELLVTPDEVPVVDLVRSGGAPGIEYEGRWIETIGAPASGAPKFFNFSYVDARRAACTKKWVLIPMAAQGAKQWRVHSVAGVSLKRDDRVGHRHFMGINSDWKRKRTHAVKFVKDRHLVDSELSRSMVRAFGMPAAFLSSGVSPGRRVVGQVDTAEFESVDESAYPMYWPDKGAGFSGLIGPWLVSLITGGAVRNVRNSAGSAGALVSSGSLLEGVEAQGVTIWGAGAAGEIRAESLGGILRSRPRRVLATRGYATRDLLLSAGLNVDPVVGDPVLLLPRFYSPRLVAGGDIVVCPDVKHAALFAQEQGAFDGCRVLDVHRSPAELVADVANASCCISSSLYGLVVAQAYGVPWVWLRLSDSPPEGGDFQFHDFFSVLSGDVVEEQVELSALQSVDYRGLAERANLPKLRCRPEDILDAFPARDDL